MSNIAYIATSLDGYISDRDDGLDWLDSIPNPDNIDMGYGDLMNRVDALVMGRVSICDPNETWRFQVAGIFRFPKSSGLSNSGCFMLAAKTTTFATPFANSCFYCAGDFRISICKRYSTHGTIEKRVAR